MSGVILSPLQANQYSATQKVQSFLDKNPILNQALTQQNTQFSVIAREAFPAVVNISSKRKVKINRISPFEFFFGDPFFDHYAPEFRENNRPPLEKEEKSLGSGFLVSQDGYIYTNYHVIRDADEIIVSTHNDREYKATLIGADKKTDVAVIKINGNKFPYLEFGDSDSLEIGEWVFALGNPFSIGSTFTVGVVSAKGRNKVGITDYEDFIQTDAAINPGNSGGPLLNSSGEVIGMNTAILTRSGGYQGIGLAIPMNFVAQIAHSLRKYGEVRRAFLGVFIQDLTPKYTKAFGIKAGTKGALISEISENSPAGKAKLEPGDIVTAFDGKPIKNAAELRNTVALSAVETDIPLEIIRKGSKQKLFVQLKLKNEPKKQMIAKQSPNTLEGSMTIEEGEGQTRGYRRQTLKEIRVTRVIPDGLADRAGIKKGDVIVSINNAPIGSIKTFRQLVKRFKPPYAILIKRKNTHYFVLAE